MAIQCRVPRNVRGIVRRLRLAGAGQSEEKPQRYGTRIVTLARCSVQGEHALFSGGAEGMTGEDTGVPL
jgi:hypothetical protein